jgi:hypothetical protein
MSKKFMTAQQNYTVHELETLAILESLQRWEDKLVGYKIHVITDHKALEFFKTQSNMSHRQRQWIDYMSRFEFDITYIKGDLNKVADCLSRYYENDTVTNIYEPHEYVCADACIDPEGDDLPGPRFQEIISQMVKLRAIQASEHRQSQRIQDRINDRDLEALLMGEPDVGDHVIPDPEPSGESPNENAMLGDSLFQRESDEKPEDLEDNHFLQAIKTGYANDKFFKLIKEKPQEYNGFSLCEGLIWTTNPRGD